MPKKLSRTDLKQRNLLLSKTLKKMLRKIGRLVPPIIHIVVLMVAFGSTKIEVKLAFLIISVHGVNRIGMCLRNTKPLIVNIRLQSSNHRNLV